MAYAEKTTVPVSRTKADIEDLVQKHGADQFISGYRNDLAMIGFSLAGRQIRFLLPLPDKQAREFQYTPGRGQRRSLTWEMADTDI